MHIYPTKGGARDLSRLLMKSPRKEKVVDEQKEGTVFKIVSAAIEVAIVWAAWTVFVKVFGWF